MHQFIQHITLVVCIDSVMEKIVRKDWFKVTELKDVHSLPLARAPESQLTAEQSLTGGHWNSLKKIPHIQRQRRSHNETVGGAQSQ